MTTAFPHSARRFLVLVAVTLIATGLFLDRPLPAQTGSAEVSADSILVTARDLAGETGVGPPSRIARRPSTEVYAHYLRDRLQAALAPLGGTAYLSPFASGLSPAGPDSLRNTYTNVIGVVPGTRGGESGGQFVLGAHWDATAQREAGFNPLTDPAPGADDNASGMAAILEALRVLGQSGTPPQADLLIAFFDGEEQQYIYDETAGEYVTSNAFLLGSNVLADSLIQNRDAGGKDIYGFINLDMVAYNPRVDSLVVLTNLTSRWLANHLVAVHGDSAATGLGAGLELTRVVRGLAFSDHGPFWQRGVDAVLLIEATQIQSHAAGHYHLSNDRVDVSFSRGGSQAAKASEMVLAMLREWSWDAAERAPRLTVQGDDLLVSRGSAVDLSQVRVGDDLQVRVSVTNRGGGEARPWSLAVVAETVDGVLLDDLGRETVTSFLPAGGTERLAFSWTPGENAPGAVRLTATITDADGQTQRASRVVGVEGPAASLVRTFVYPNPTRDPATAVLHYELARAGAVRIALLGLDGRELFARDYSFDPVIPAAEVDVGEAEIPLDDLLRGAALAPGLYLIRVELFAGDGGSADVAVAKMAVIR